MQLGTLAKYRSHIRYHHCSALASDPAEVLTCPVTHQDDQRHQQRTRSHDPGHCGLAYDQYDICDANKRLSVLLLCVSGHVQALSLTLDIDVTDDKLTSSVQPVCGSPD